MKTVMTVLALSGLILSASAHGQEAAKPVLPQGQTQPEAPVKDPAASEADVPDVVETNLIKPADPMFFAATEDDRPLAASELIGQTVYDADDAEIGTVADFVTSADGSKRALVIKLASNGGAAKQVAVSFLDIDRKEGGAFTRLVLDMGKDELMAAPAFEMSTAAGAADATGAEAAGATDTPAPTAAEPAAEKPESGASTGGETSEPAKKQ